MIVGNNVYIEWYKDYRNGKNMSIHEESLIQSPIMIVFFVPRMRVGRNKGMSRKYHFHFVLMENNMKLVVKV